MRCLKAGIGNKSKMVYIGRRVSIKGGKRMQRRSGSEQSSYH